MTIWMTSDRREDWRKHSQLGLQREIKQRQKAQNRQRGAERKKWEEVWSWKRRGIRG